ncbi:MAG: AAA family ATPase [Neomegalonema sp.]|nr:AAA family ATPase [Neomegalonema sp.]
MGQSSEFTAQFTDRIEPALYLTPDHFAAIDGLMTQIGAGTGITTLCGPFGAGKTTLMRKVIADMPGNEQTSGRYGIALPDPSMTFSQVVSFLHDTLGAADAAQEAGSKVEALRQRLFQLASAGERVVLFVDRAEALSPSLTERIPRLPKIGVMPDGSPVGIQVVLVGDTSFQARLDAGTDKVMSAIAAQAASFKLRYFNEREVSLYLDSTLRDVLTCEDGLPVEVTNRIAQDTLGCPHLLQPLAVQMQAILRADPDRPIDHRLIAEIWQREGLDQIRAQLDENDWVPAVEELLDLGVRPESIAIEMAEGPATAMDSALAHGDMPPAPSRFTQISTALSDLAQAFGDRSLRAETPTPSSQRRKIRTVRAGRFDRIGNSIPRIGLGLTALVFVGIAYPVLDELARSRLTEVVDTVESASEIALPGVGLDNLDVDAANDALAEAVSATGNAAGASAAQLDETVTKTYATHRDDLLDAVDGAISVTEDAVSGVADSTLAPTWLRETLDDTAKDLRETRDTLAISRAMEQQAKNRTPEQEAQELERRAALQNAQIADYLDQAAAHIEAERLTQPKDLNAYDTYLRVLMMDPGNAAASAGIDKLVQIYEAKADAALDRKRYEDFHRMNHLIQRLIERRSL